MKRALQLHPFISSPRARPGCIHLALVSVAIHAALLSMVVKPVASTPPPDAARPDSGATTDTVAYIAADVDRRVRANGVRPIPRYPPELADRMVEATFSVYFVVDTLGRIEPATIEVPPSVNEEFARAVRDVLGAWRFVPAQHRGRPVRQMVEQTITFRMAAR